jgi:hypothetical protein
VNYKNQGTLYDLFAGFGLALKSEIFLDAFNLRPTHILERMHLEL